MSKRKGIGEAIVEQDEKVANALRTYVPMDKYHDIMEDVHKLCDLYMVAAEMTLKQSDSGLTLNSEVPKAIG